MYDEINIGRPISLDEDEEWEVRRTWPLEDDECELSDFDKPLEEGQRLTVRMVMPVEVKLVANEDWLDVYINDDHYDLVAPPLDAKDKILALIAQHGIYFTRYVPEEWEAQF